MNSTLSVLLCGFLLINGSLALAGSEGIARQGPKVPEVTGPWFRSTPSSSRDVDPLQRPESDPAGKPRLGPANAIIGDNILPWPKKGAEVPMAKIREICRHFGLHDLWRKIEQDPPPLPFRSDGCSLWFDEWREVDLYPACFLHDLKYWAGYPHEDVERLIADAELMIDVARLTGSTAMAETMFHGVRPGGHEIFQQPFSWGFGRAKK